MLTFLLLAAALMAATVALVGVPLLRRGAAPPATAAAFVAAAVLMFGSSLLYVVWSNWPWHAAAAAPDSPQTMVARLARKMEREPDNLSGWLMLGHSYTVLQEYPLALRAYQRAERLSGGKSSEALIGEAEALALSDETELDGRAGRLIERALTLAPDSGKALFYGAAVAMRRNDLALARSRFNKLLAMNPPDNVRAVLEQQIAALDARQAAPAAAAGAVAGEPAVRLTITAADNMAANGAPLFVFVRSAGQGGPPLAAKRLESHFPQSVTLTPADAMIPGRTFAPGQQLEVIARIARSGNPVGASGDPFGKISYEVGKDGLRDLRIDRITP
jgi:cytochrome c-type biogenesis protein CcmH